MNENFFPPQKKQTSEESRLFERVFFLPGCAFPRPRRADGTPLPPRGSCWGSKLASALTSLISYVSLLEPEPERCEPPGRDFCVCLGFALVRSRGLRLNNSNDIFFPLFLFCLYATKSRGTKGKSSNYRR